MPDVNHKAVELQKKYQAEEDAAAAQEDEAARAHLLSVGKTPAQQPSDDEVLAAWQQAIRNLRLKAPKYPEDDLRAPGDPLAETSSRADVQDVREGYNGAVYGMRAGTPLDVAPTPGGRTDEADGLRWLETPFSAMDRDLERMEGTPEYERVKELYGPARMAYHRKHNLDINTGKPKTGDAARPAVAPTLH